jgi:Nucleotidyl transferase AbiEii toxin, Type IV TA system
MAQVPLNLHLDILPASQRQLWDELDCIPDFFTLYGGTALALRLGHRQSVDFDLFAYRDIALDELTNTIPLLTDAEIIQQQANTLSVLVDRNGPVSMSFFGLPKLFALADADRANHNGLHIASLLDIAATKAAVVQVRAEAKDYLDIDALLTLGGMNLATALAAACSLYGPTFNPQITLKALSYFLDGDVASIPSATKERLADAARMVDLDKLPIITARNSRQEQQQ